jgi:predicted tellurium resistance membrane protein TerC
MHSTRIAKIILGEMIVLIASVLIFRSLWTLLDQYIGYSHLIEMLAIGIILAIAGLVLLNHEVKCEMDSGKTAKTNS